jgi:multisubunit Na+/H+ antiporter MnhB subunit
MVEIYISLAFIILAALVAVESHNLISSVIALGAIGLGLCILFLFLGAPELAMTQLVVEILALIILIRATVSTTVPETYRGRERLAYGVVTVFIGLFGWLFYSAARELPPFGSPVAVLNTALAGVTNAVAGVVLSYRVFDTLGAMALFFTAALGVFTILRLKGRKQINERDEADS